MAQRGRRAYGVGYTCRRLKAQGSGLEVGVLQPSAFSIFRAQYMSYKSPLETRLAKKVTKAITEYSLIEDGDRVMVGLSGGKDSWALLNILDVLRRRAPIQFSLVAVCVDSGYKEYKHDLIAKTCVARGWGDRSEQTTTGEVMEDRVGQHA